MEILRLILASFVVTSVTDAFPLSMKLSDSSAFTYLGKFSTDKQYSLHQRAKRSTDTSSNQESFYFRSQNSASWNTAIGDCKAFLHPSATLLYIETEEELGNITSYLQSSDDIGSLYWIGGLYDTDRATFTWGTYGTEFGDWVPWQDGHPNTKTPVSRVAASPVGTVKFLTRFSTESARFICELKSEHEDIGQESQDQVGLPCYKDNDLVILLDSSESIGEEEYQMGLEFSAKLAYVWAENPGNRVAFIVFSNDAYVVLSLKDYSSSVENNDIKKRVHGAPYLKGRTASNLGLDLAYREIQQNNRSSVPQSVVFLTDGASNWPLYTAESAERLLHTDINIISVGIGENVKAKELWWVAGNRTENVFRVEEFQDLLELLQPVSTRICEGL